MTKQISFDQIELVTYGAYDTFPGKLNPITAAIRGESEMGGGGGLGKILSVAVAIAVPFVAPMVASAVFGASVMAGAVTGTLASVATGAVLGGAGAALTGGDWRKGALFGGLGAGFTQGMGGFGSTNNPLFGQATTTNAGWFGPTGAPVLGQGSTSAVAQNPDLLTAGANVVDETAAASTNATLQGQPQTLQATNASGVSNTLSSQPSVVSPAANLQGGTVNTALSSPTNVASGGTNYGLTATDYSLYQPSTGLTTPSGGVGIKVPAGFDIAAKPTTFTGELASRFTNPARMADMAILATPQILGQVYATQAGKEQQQRIDQYQQELKALEGKDQRAYEIKLAEAQEYIANAKNMNPNYWAQMSANQANITGARRLAESYRDAPMAGLRDLSGERRRDALALTQNVGTAYNQGYQSGVGLRDQAMRTGYSMIPNAPRTGLEGQRQMASMYADLDNSRAAAAQGVSQTASYFTYPFLSNYRV